MLLHKQAFLLPSVKTAQRTLAKISTFPVFACLLVFLLLQRYNIANRLIVSEEERNRHQH